MKRAIVLLTDFGHKDHYVGVIKGIIATIAPQARLIDLCHEVPPQDIRSGAYLLGVSYRFFPKGSIFLSVVDPGVGTDRRIVIAQLGDWYFVSPDNGLLTLVGEREKLKQAIQVTNSRYWLSPVSSTFHGRDIMAPVAAHLYRGGPLKKFGRPIKGPLVTLRSKPAMKKANSIEGEIFYVDHFGNLITNIPAEMIPPPDLSHHLVYPPKADSKEAVLRTENQVVGLSAEGGFKRSGPSDRKSGGGMIPSHRQCKVSIAHKKMHRIVRSYGEAGVGEWVAVVASADLLEIAVNQGSAQKEIQAKVGDPVKVEWD